MQPNPIAKISFANSTPLRALDAQSQNIVLAKRARPLPLSRAMPDAEPFPIGDLGELLGPAATAIHDLTQAPIEICAQSTLAVAALATQSHADVVLPTGHAKPLSCFFLTIAASGERKTAVDTEALRPVRERESRLRVEYEAALPGSLNELDAWDAQRKSILADKRNFKTKEDKAAALHKLGPKPKMPLRGILTVSEPTFEGLTKLMPDNQPSIGLFSGEGGSFIGGHGMSDESKLRTAAGLSVLWDGDALKRVRSGDGTTVLAGRRLSLHLMAQPDVAGGMLSDRVLMDQGLLSRFLVCAPRSAAGTRIWREPSLQSEPTLSRYRQQVLEILGLPAPLIADTRNELNPRRLSLSATGREQWTAFADHIEGLIAPGGQLEPIKGLANKLPEHAARLAAVLELTTNLTAPEVSDACMASGIRLAQFYAGEALRLYNASRLDPDLSLAQRVFDWISSEGHKIVSLGMVYQHGPNPVRDAKTARRIMKILVEHNQVEPIDDAEIDGCRVREAWSVAKEG